MIHGRQQKNRPLRDVKTGKEMTLDLFCFKIKGHQL